MKLLLLGLALGVALRSMFSCEHRMADAVRAWYNECAWELLT